MFVEALSVAGSIYLILEMDQPDSGLIKISSGPLRTALDAQSRAAVSPKAHTPGPSLGLASIVSSGQIWFIRAIDFDG